jgi:hypothetical protein
MKPDAVIGGLLAVGTGEDCEAVRHARETLSRKA